jgi:3-hydroxyisobutyrate dehydrogenase
MRLAFIGLGIMGGPMAGHLLAAEHPLVVNTRTQSRANDLLARGATWAPFPADAAHDADVIFLCLPDTPDVETVLLSDNGVIHGAKPGAIIVDHSTISPAATRAMATRMRDRDIMLLDAPISGGDVGAKNATLSIMVGGDARAFATVEPLLRLMGKTITHCGDAGTGQLTKLVNQILVTVTNLATCEALTFAKNNGLDLSKTITALAGGAAGSWQWANLGPKMIAGDFAPGFTIDLQQKDLRLVMEAARASASPVPAASLVHQLFTSAQEIGNGKEGTQALFKVVQRLAGGA